MGSVLEQLTADADLVILDTTPLLMVSDAFPLLDKVSGVVALARLDKTPRDAITKMTQIMTSVGARVLGIVATDARRSRIYGYGYGYGAGYGEERRAKDPAEQAKTAIPQATDEAEAAAQPPN